MDTPSPERWQRIEELLDEALELPAAQRAGFLRAACGADAQLLVEVTRLLEAGEGEVPVLDSPAAAFAADLLQRGATGAGTTPAPVLIGPWRIVRELGRGGMGTVDLAEREAHYRQRAALKVVRRGLHLDAELVRRFVAERQVLASLEHAGIARLLDGGVTGDGVPWFAMEFVEGAAIDRWCDARRLSIDARIELFCAVCDVVEYAHRQQVVHRDLKPSNIHVRDDGTVKLLDFGIARLIAPDDEAAAQLTRTGLRLFTPEYASPEQIRGDAATPASDVYSLGVLLYELLTGRRPYRVTGRTTNEVEKAVLEQEPERPSAVVLRAVEPATGDAAAPPSTTQLARARESTPERLSQRLRGELDRIVLHAMAKEPGRRYGSAEALATDLRRHLEGLPVTARRPALQRARVLASLAGLAVVVALTLTGLRLSRSRSSGAGTTPVLAVGLFADYRAERPAELARPLADLLAMNLARLPGLRVISSARMYELMAQLGGADDDPGTHTAAARRAGATSLVDGAVFALDDGGMRLDLRRVDLASGDVIAVHSVVGTNVFALVDSGTARVAAEAGLRAPGSVADITTHSEVAYRLYEEGLRAYYVGDQTGARRLFESALAEDSALAMAAFYLARTTPDEAARPAIERALRLAERTSDRERLIIRAYWARWTSDPTLGATAETLAVRYPNEVDGNLYAARAAYEALDYPTALRRLRQVVTADSVALRGNATLCAACDALSEILYTYQAMDSLDAAIREARMWAELQPRAAAPRVRLGGLLNMAGRIIEGRDAYRRGAELDPSYDGHPSYYAYHYMTTGDFTTTDAALREIARSGTPERQAWAAWYLGISLRWQGRYAEALEAVRPFRALISGLRPPTAPERFAFQEAQALFEMGRYRESIALFDSMASAPGITPSHEARYAAWSLTHAANAHAALGDTILLAALADTIGFLGSRSLLGRDQRLHHHVRGLLLTVRGDDDAAIEEFRRAMISTAVGYTRAHYELARGLVRRGRAREAIAVLQPVIPAAVEASALYLTRPELEEVLAQAWDAVGNADSAVVHLRNVAHAWQNADPILRDRVRAVRSRLAALEAGRRTN